MYLRIIYIFLISLFIDACSDSQADKLDSKSIKEQMDERKIHRVKPADILNQTATTGKLIINKINKKYIENIKDQIQSKSFEESIKQCNINLPIKDSLQKYLMGKIKRLSLKGKLPPHLNKKEIEMWDAYRYNVENKIPIKENSQHLGDSLMLYTSGIIINDQVCLKCHGNIEKDISINNFKILKKSFPQMDSLVNYKMNDAIGIWSLLIDKKSIIKKIR